MSVPPANILIFISDQLARRAVGCYGDRYARTPNIDGLAADGVRFDRAYTPFALCCPARASFWTGKLPHATGVVSNGREYPIVPVTEDVPTVGAVFREAGYETVHFGKKHDAGTLRGFDCAEEGELPVEGSEAWPVDYDSRRDAFTTERCVEYLQGRSGRAGKPFLMVADLQNPHDICNWIGAFKGPHEDVAPPGELPELPSNFEVTDWENRPRPVQYLCCSHRRLSQAAQWSESNYRHYLAAYYHYLERVDTQIGRIMEALRASGAAENTLVLFFSDHGDSITSHRMVTKQVSFYEETTRVPFIASGPGVEGAGRVEQPLVSLVDLFPTLCDYAGVEAPEGLHGRSLVPWLRGEEPAAWREFVPSEWVTEWGYTVAPGRMIRTDRYKYTRYLEEDGEELFDLQADPGETRTLARDPAYAEELARHRELLEAHIEATGDNFRDLEVKADARWRSHAPGFTNHHGPSAPDAGGVGG